MTAHELVIRLGRPFDVQFRGEHSGAPFAFSTAAEIRIPFNDRESAFAAHREITVTVRPVHDAGAEDYRPVLAGEVVQTDGGRHDALRKSARDAHAAGEITQGGLEDRLRRSAFMERQADGA